MSDAIEAVSSLEAIQQRLVALAEKSSLTLLAAPLADVSEICGIFKGGAMPDQETTAMMLRFSSALSGILQVLEVQLPVSDFGAREMYADLLELEVDDHGYYSSERIDGFREIARDRLIGK